MIKQEHNNQLDRPNSWAMRLGMKVLPGLRTVQSQIIPYANAWTAANKQALLQKGPLWIVIGDSMSQGIGASSYKKGWVGQLADMLEGSGRHYRILNLSVSGARVADALQSQLPTLKRYSNQVALVTVLIGSNDLLKRRYRKNLVHDYIRLLEALPSGTIIATPFGDVGIGKALNSLVTDYAKEHGLIIMNNKLGTTFSAWRGKLAEDHFHPNNLGYAGLAKGFYDTITEQT